MGPATAQGGFVVGWGLFSACGAARLGELGPGVAEGRLGVEEGLGHLGAGLGERGGDREHER